MNVEGGPTRKMGRKAAEKRAGPRGKLLSCLHSPALLQGELAARGMSRFVLKSLPRSPTSSSLLSNTQDQITSACPWAHLLSNELIPSSLSNPEELGNDCNSRWRGVELTHNS